MCEVEIADLTPREQELFDMLLSTFIFPFTDTILDCNYIDPYVLTKRYVDRVIDKLTFKVSEKTKEVSSLKIFEDMKACRELKNNYYKPYEQTK